MKKWRIDKETVAWWTYLALLVGLAVYGLWDSTAAELLIRVLKDAFSLIIE